MFFQNRVVCLALAGGVATSTAFAPSPSTSAQMRMVGRDLTPADLIAPGWKRTSPFALTETLRWEMRSTLAKSGGDTETEEAEGELPDFPARLVNGIFDIQNDAQHK